MYHPQLEMGAVMADADGWQLPAHYGDATRESNWLREAVGISDVSPLGKIRIVGDGAAQAVAVLIPAANQQTVGSVTEADSPLERGGKLLSARLALDEFLVLTPTGVAPEALNAVRLDDGSCAHAVDVTSALCAFSLIGPATNDLLSRITELDTSAQNLPHLACAQSRFADVQGLLIRRDVNDTPIYALYAAREFGEYLWEALIETAKEVGGGPVGTEALLGLRS